MLLRVSSNQQLEADGDLGIQRQLVKEYIEKQADWILDGKEYFEGSCSGYKNAAADRKALQEALKDAKAKEYDILAAYKDDRIGRRMWDIGAYVMALKSCGIDIYTVKDGCISPETDDSMGQMALAFRYLMAQKSSSDTGMRVRDTAEKLVQKGRFMGGAAPYGYRLELSGEVSKHGRALHRLAIVPECAEAVAYIYDLSLNKEYGSAKIARILNGHETYKNLAPKTVWKSGTVTSILTNPIYAGHTAYKRRERTNGKSHRLDSRDWIVSRDADETIRIIDEELWNRAQEKRRRRRELYSKTAGGTADPIIKRNDGMLALIDVLHCGYCGRKMTNGSRYNYWTIKATGEKRRSKTAAYKCQAAWQGIPHSHGRDVLASRIEPAVFEVMAEHIERLQKQEDIFLQIEKSRNQDRNRKEEEWKKEEETLAKIQKKIFILEEHIPDAMTGGYPLSLPELAALIQRHREQMRAQQEIVRKKEEEYQAFPVFFDDGEDGKCRSLTWRDIFFDADTSVKRVLANRMIKRIDVKKTELVIWFRIGKNFDC